MSEKSSRIVLVLEVLKSFGSVLELAMRWMNDLSLFVAFDCEVMFLMAIFLRSFSFRLTCDRGGKMLGDEYEMLLYCASVSWFERARWSASSFPLMFWWPGTQCKWTWCDWPTTFKWWTSVLIVEVFILVWVKDDRTDLESENILMRNRGEWWFSIGIIWRLRAWDIATASAWNTELWGWRKTFPATGEWLWE